MGPFDRKIQPQKKKTSVYKKTKEKSDMKKNITSKIKETSCSSKK